MQALPANEFIKLISTYPVIDVRTPAEFYKGHIPVAVNIPLFSNDERKIIGTLYKKEGKKTSMLKGMELVSTKFTDFIRSAEKLSPEGTLLVNCWRGGMRSAGMAWLFEWYGFKVYTLIDGYKAFRRMVVDTFAKPFNINILGGRTGSGKTLILNELGKFGQTIINLEKIANHKGSAFGILGESQQPTQEMFENILAIELLSIPESAILWLEDESQNIGKRIIPNPLYKQMREAKVYLVEIPFEVRVEYLVKTYGRYRNEELIASIEKIKKRLGPQHAKAAIEAIQSGDFKAACEICLKYYDKSYDHGMAKREHKKVIKKSFADIDIIGIAKDILQDSLNCKS